ncbi:MAG: hypothetical protein M0Z61_03680 [Nitrospiraceae bacterium]|nr:hypothetical protein [Nitrospiraceae bacterium]
MNFFFIDYSDLYFRTIKKIEMPGRRSGKFVQIFDDASGDEYLVLSPKELSVYHANIVERFCALKGIEGSYNSKKDFFTLHSGEWAVIGGGLWGIDDTKKIFEFSGASQRYGAFEAAGMKSKLLNSVALTGYSFLINGF